MQQGSFQEGESIFKIRTCALSGGPRQRCTGSEPILYLHHIQGVRLFQCTKCISLLSHRGYRSFRLSRFLHCMSGPQLILCAFSFLSLHTSSTFRIMCIMLLMDAGPLLEHTSPSLYTQQLSGPSDPYSGDSRPAPMGQGRPFGFQVCAHTFKRHACLRGCSSKGLPVHICNLLVHFSWY